MTAPHLWLARACSCPPTVQSIHPCMLRIFGQPLHALVCSIHPSMHAGRSQHARSTLQLGAPTIFRSRVLQTLVLTVSRMLFRPRVWRFRTYVFGGFEREFWACPSLQLANGFALVLKRFRRCSCGPMSGAFERKFLACPSLAGVWPFRIWRRRTPCSFHVRNFALVLAVSKRMLFRPRVWRFRTHVYGLPELAFSWC